LHASLGKGVHLDQERLIRNLTQALSSFIDEGQFLEPLAQGIVLFLQNETVALDALKAVFGCDYKDVLLLAFDWKLILPLLPSKSSAWEELALSGINAPLYTIPKAVFYVVREAMKEGVWDVDKGLKVMFQGLDIPLSPARMLELVLELFHSERFMCVSAWDITLSCRAVGVPWLRDQVIAIFKSLGIISPKLAYLGKLNPILGPLYDVNPSLRRKQIG